jgi:hypothetical protein
VLGECTAIHCNSALSTLKNGLKIVENTAFSVYWQERVAETSTFVNTQQFWLKSDNMQFYAYLR